MMKQMTDNTSSVIRKFDRRTLLRNGLLSGLGIAGIGAASVSAAGPAQAFSNELAPEQPNWAWCKICCGMFYTRQINFGWCPAGGAAFPHADSGPYTSYNYRITYDSAGTDYQSNWHWCNVCQEMFHGNLEDGLCPGTNGETPHDGTSSYPYVMYYGSGNIGQPNWYWCRNCFALFHTTSSDRIGGSCIINNRNYNHDGSDSYPYQVDWSGTIGLGSIMV
jgi:hypothetical protein